MNTEIEIAERVRLTYTQPPSNKEYRLELVRSGDGWIVNFAYGRIGSALKTGAKTNAPTDYASARTVYDRQLASKLNEGYIVDGADGASQTAGYQAPTAKEDTGLRPQLLEPITLDDATQYIGGDRWWMQPKYDGNRVFVIANDTEVYGANRKGQRISLPLTVVEWTRSKAERFGGFVLDGELVGETYFVFDILRFNSNWITRRPYQFRLSALAVLMRQSLSDAETTVCVVLAETAKTFVDKAALFDRLDKENAEGVVFKRMDAPYKPGRFETQVKCKFWESASFIVKAQNVGVRSIELGLLCCADGDEIVGWGNCTVPSNYALPAVSAIVEVKYLYVDDHVYQPQYLGERTDVDRKDCVPGQLKFKPGSRHATT
ncbi:hypothetical protein ANRL1_00855 [Anaerolineae bacterium]|nr:hypothetical protein ANRL1_00855 [Anaerolineae bacterium]